WSPFHLYYFGQDRFGALPFQLAQLWHALSGFVWTPERLTVALAVFVFLGAWPLSRMLRPPLLWTVVYCGAVLFVAERSAPLLFDLSQPCGWQLTLVWFAWWSVRGRIGARVGHADRVCLPRGPFSRKWSRRTLPRRG